MSQFFTIETTNIEAGSCFGDYLG